MNENEAKQLLSERLELERQRAFPDLRRLVLAGEVTTFETKGTSDTEYQVELQYVWDDKPEGTVRILGSIDDGGLRSYAPLSQSELVLPPAEPQV